MIVVTGVKSVLLGGSESRAGAEPKTVDPTPFLRARKSRKFMGIQDDLAVVAAGQALAEAGLGAVHLRERAGLYAAIGYIPFNHEDIAPVLAGSVRDGHFSMERFSNGGFQAAHPLLTFRCLPNMPAYHVSANFDIQGPYFVTYPGPAQLYAALDEARYALDSAEVDVAVVIGVAHQRNFLVAHHFERSLPPLAPSVLCDAGACLVLERAESALARGALVLGELHSLHTEYQVHDPISDQIAERETFEGAPAPFGPPPRSPPGALGPAALLCALDAAWHGSSRGPLAHRILTRDHVTAASDWRGRA